MNDSDFKNMGHQVGNNRIATNGEQVSTGYNPDLTISDKSDNVECIIESKQKTERKEFG